MAAPVIDISKAHKALVVPFKHELANLIPGSKRVTWRGQDSLVVKHGLDQTVLCRNYGLPVPAPILHHYDWPGPQQPFEAQRQTAAMLTTEKRAYVLNGMGTGKTRTVIWAYDFLREQGVLNKMLVVAPLSTLTNTWLKELFVVAPHLRATVLHGTAEKRRKLLAANFDVYIINHDGVATVMDEIMTRRDIDLVVLDELAVYRNAQSKRNKGMRRVLATKEWAWGLTGSPMPNEPTDVFGQAKLITPWRVNMPFSRFRDQMMNKISQFRYVPRPEALNIAYDTLHPSVRYTLDDVVELPEVVFQAVRIEQGTKQQEVYKELQKHLQAKFDKGELTVANSGVLMNKLLQVSLGWVYTNERGVVSLDNEHRLQTLVDTIESVDRKVIVFVPFIHALEGIKAHLTKHKIDVATVSGDTPISERVQIFTAFQQSSRPRVLVAHPQCMAHGLTLTAADTIIWFSPFASLEVFDQANARITRIGQKHRQRVIMFAGTAVEAQLYKRLHHKQQVQGTLLDMLRDNTSKKNNGL